MAECWSSQDVGVHVPRRRAVRTSRGDRHLQRPSHLPHENTQQQQAEDRRTAHAQTERRGAHGACSSPHLRRLSAAVPRHGNHLSPGHSSNISILSVSKQEYL